MSSSIPFVRTQAARYGVLEPIAPHIRRIVARNPGPFTELGTGTYVLGRGDVVVVDPGPASIEHIDALLRGLGSERVSHILVTHTHLDHSPAARLLSRRTHALCYGFGPHRRAVAANEDQTVEAGADLDFVPDVLLRDGEVIHACGLQIECVHTPGHCSNHLCFRLRAERALFTGDHVMGWSTTVIEPPDGNMADYMRSLEGLLTHDDQRYYPTHGGAINEPHTFVNALLEHRRTREQQIQSCLGRGISRIELMVPLIYSGTPPSLYPAAARSVFAHILHLIEKGCVTTDGVPTLGSTFRAASSS